MRVEGKGDNKSNDNLSITALSNLWFSSISTAYSSTIVCVPLIQTLRVYINTKQGARMI